MRILLTGRDGQVGWELVTALAALGDLAAVDREECDLADPDQIVRLVREAQPDVIVNAAAYKFGLLLLVFCDQIDRARRHRRPPARTAPPRRAPPARDHCSGIRTVLERGRVGEVYSIGGNAERKNIDVVRTLCAILDELRPRASATRAALITFVKDRPGHDRRYAIDASKVSRELGWRPAEAFETGIRKTVEWYLANMKWVTHAASGEYRTWVERNYGNRVS